MRFQTPHKNLDGETVADAGVLAMSLVTAAPYMDPYWSGVTFGILDRDIQRLAHSALHCDLAAPGI
jgi:hypothetical protein